MKKLAWFLIVTLLAEIALLASVQLGQVQAYIAVNGIITSDTTWTKANSPYTFSGPVAVNKGVTLTIEAGTIINASNTYLQVNGTLKILGTKNEPVQFKGSQIIFNSEGAGWEEQSDSGSRIEYANINVDRFLCSSSLKIVNSNITSKDIKIADTLGRQSDFKNNHFLGTLETSNADISDSQIGILKATDSQIMRSTVNHGLTGNSLTIVDSVIYGPEPTPYGDVSAMTLEGKITITNSIVNGGGQSYDFFFRETHDVPAIEIDNGQILISNNTLNGGIKASLKTQRFQNQPNEVSNNIVTGQINVHGSQLIIFGNQVAGTIGASGSTVVIQKNIAKGISFGGSSIVVSDNTVSNGDGIKAYTEDSSVIERNLIFNNTNGIRCSSTGITISNNTIKDNNIGIYIENAAPTVSYNNIQNNTNNIYLTSAENVEALNNYWGTNDQLKIGYSIHDFYDDFNLGKVDYLPALAMANPQALPDPNTTPPEMKLNEINQNQLFSILSPLAAAVVVAALITAGFVLVKRKRSKKQK